MAFDHLLADRPGDGALGRSKTQLVTIQPQLYAQAIQF